MQKEWAAAAACRKGMVPSGMEGSSADTVLVAAERAAAASRGASDAARADAEATATSRTSRERPKPQ